MDPEKPKTSLAIHDIDRMMDRWRLRLLTHGAASELGMEATRQLSKLEARKEHLNAQG